jgi:hypothetical protein
MLVRKAKYARRNTQSGRFKKIAVSCGRATNNMRAPHQTKLFIKNSSAGLGLVRHEEIAELRG